MHDVKVNRTELLDIVRKNKEKHIAEFNEAVSDYLEVVIKITGENLGLAETRNFDQLAKIKSIPAPPTSYESSYARSIRMLELSVDEIVELDEHTFNQLVLDEWQWKQMFTTSNLSYKTY